MTAAPCSCWDSPVTLHDGHCCMRSADGRIPTCQSIACRICTGCAHSRPDQCRLTVRCPVDEQTRPCRYAPKVGAA